MKTKLTQKDFYLLSFTWGIVITLIGLIITFVLLTMGKKPKKNYYGWYFEMGENWGGCNFGCVSLVANNPTLHDLSHEFGHAVQNCKFGPAMLFIVLASAIRYWYRRYLRFVKNIPHAKLPPYDSIWFEKEATDIGKYYFFED